MEIFLEGALQSRTDLRVNGLLLAQEPRVSLLLGVLFSTGSIGNPVKLFSQTQSELEISLLVVGLVCDVGIDVIVI